MGAEEHSFRMKELVDSGLHRAVETELAAIVRGFEQALIGREVETNDSERAFLKEKHRVEGAKKLARIFSMGLERLKDLEGKPKRKTNKAEPTA